MTQNPNALSATAMAAHLDMSRANLDKLVSDGVVTRERDGRVNPDAVRVIRHLRRVSRLNPHTESRARYEAAKARELELRDAQKEDFSILTEESLATVDDITGLFLTVYPALDGPRLSHPRGRALRRLRTLRSSGPPERPAPSDICRRACAGRVRPLSRPGRPETAPALALLIPGWLYLRSYWRRGV